MLQLILDVSDEKKILSRSLKLHFSNMKLNVASFCEYQRLFELGPPQKLEMLQKLLQRHQCHFVAGRGTKLIAIKKVSL